MMKFLIGGAAAAAVLAGGAAIANTAPTTKLAPGAQNSKMAQTETRADVQAAIAKMFARLDANKDGFVAKAELSTIEAKRDAKLEQRAERFDPAKLFANLDTDKDGKLTSAEADAALAKRATASGKPAAARAGGASALFARADANKDKVVTRAEFETFGGKVRARLEKAAQKDGPAERMFGQSDTNKDGRVSLAEMQQNALAHFDRLDSNKDGKVTPAERNQARQQMKAAHKPG